MNNAPLVDVDPALVLKIQQRNHDQATIVANIAVNEYAAGLITLSEFSNKIRRIMVPDPVANMIDRNTGLKY